MVIRSLKRNDIQQHNLLFVALLSLFFTSCAKKEETLFTLLSPSQTGITFENKITDTDSLNILDYLYYYNGGGVAIGDINNDGLADIYFSSNIGSNKLYLNKGDFKFEDITGKAGVQGKGNWKTGITIVDVNGDGLADIYVCEVGAYKGFKGRNELFINNGSSARGEVTFTERAHEYGLDAEGFNTQSVFFDFDRDGDLDMFLVNHSVHSTDTYVDAAARLVKNNVSGDKLFRNDHNHFIEVTEEAKIYSSIIGYGLNAVVGDLNNDGWDDIYVSNDFHENDYYYVNQQNGTFKELNATAFGHESRFSMGSDIADINNDGWLDIITLDMLPATEKVLKTSDGDDPPEIFKYKLSYGYHYQYARNCLQLNNGGGKSYSDIALYAGIAATDWSWSPLVADFDNDGIKDLFVSNGILKRPNDLDYLKFISSEYYGNSKSSISALDAIKKMPSGKVVNFIFRGTDSLKFQNKTSDWGLDQLSFSNGAAYADLDNDGDLDLVVNNINQPAFVYRNNATAQIKNHFLEVQLNGPATNKFAIGAKVMLKQNDSIQLVYIGTTKGFESSSLQYVHFGTGNKTSIDTVQIIWPDGSIENRFHVKTDQRIEVNFVSPAAIIHSLLPGDSVAGGQLFFKDLTDSIKLPFEHREDNFDDFNRQALMPHQVSAQGPKMAVADINGDGLDDFFICGATGQSGKLFVQTAKGNFVSTNEKVFAADSIIEEVNAVFFDANNDHYPDLYVVSGGNDEQARKEELQDRLFLNDGKGNFSKSDGLPPMFGNKSEAVASDIDHDGDMDLFVGGRVVAGSYGVTPQSYLLLNDGSGKFTVAAKERATGLANIGMVTAAVFTDLDKDGWDDLVVVGEWMPVTVFKNNKGDFKNVTRYLQLENTTGLWNTITSADVNNDGFKDLLVGNLGENSKLHASENFPLKLYVGDMDGNGAVDQIMAIENEKNYYPFLGKPDLEKQLPGLIRKNYPDYTSMAGVTIDKAFGAKLDSMKLLSANMLSSIVIINDKGALKPTKLPPFAQWSPIYTFCAGDVNGDGKIDLITGGNFYGVIPYEGRYDAVAVNVLMNTNNGFSKAGFHTGLNVTGQVRDIKKLRTIHNKFLYIFVRNNDDCVIARMH